MEDQEFEQEFEESPEPQKKKKLNLNRIVLFLLIFLVTLAAVYIIGVYLPSQESSPAATPTNASTNKPASTRTLAPTFTPKPTEVVFTPTPPPAGEPTATRTVTPTFITLPTRTETATLEPGQDTPTPGPEESTITPTQEIACGVRAIDVGVVINIAPFIDIYHILPTMEPGVVYEATVMHPTYYGISLNGQAAGWVDYRLLAIDLIGENCDGLPLDQTELTEFPGLCFLETLTDDASYADSQLTQEPAAPLPKGARMVVLHATSKSYFTAYGHAGPSVYVDASKVRLSGDCDTIASVGEAAQNAWLWSDPDGENGTQLSFITAGTILYVQGDAVDGPPPPGIESNGDWHLVMAGRQEDGTYGWLWSDSLEFK